MNNTILLALSRMPKYIWVLTAITVLPKNLKKKINMIIARMMKKILHSTGFGPNDQVGFFLIKFCFVAVWIPQQSYTCFRIWSPVSYKSFDTNSTRRKKRNEWLYFFGWVYNFSSLQSSEWIVTNRVPEVRFSSFQNQLKS